jgi:hypothetical protein
LSYDFSPCGTLISTWADIAAAIDDASDEPAPQVVTIPGGTYVHNAKINLIDPNGGGITVRAEEGQVVEVVGTTTAPAFDAVSPDMAVEGLFFADVPFPIKADTGATRMRVVGNRFLNSAASTSTQLVQILADDVVVDANHFTGVGSTLGAGIRATGVTGLEVTANVMLVTNTEAMWFTGSTVTFDHNAVNNANASQGHALKLETSTICARNNVLMTSGTNGWATVITDNASTADDASCMPATGNNLVYRQAGAASVCYAGGGTGCDDVCGAGLDALLCDDYGLPDADITNQCPTPGGNLVDTGVDTGYDTTPGQVGDFVGAAPDRGPLERPSTRTYGGDVVSCD